MTLWRSKSLWTVAALSEIVITFIAYDRYKLRQMERGLREEAERLGATPVASQEERPRRVTIVAFGADKATLSSQRSLWRQYAAELFTRAGCDYEWIAFDAATLDREIDQLVPVPDGVPPPPPPADAQDGSGGKSVAKVVTVENWLRPMALQWAYLANGNTQNSLSTRLDRWRQETDPLAMAMVKVWQQKCTPPKTGRFWKEGIVATTGDAYDALLAGIEDWFVEEPSSSRPGSWTRGVSDPETLTLGYLPLEPPSSWSCRLYNFFHKRELAEKIGIAAMEIIRNETRRRSINELHPAAEITRGVHLAGYVDTYN